MNFHVRAKKQLLFDQCPKITGCWTVRKSFGTHNVLWCWDWLNGPRQCVVRFYFFFIGKCIYLYVYLFLAVLGLCRRAWGPLSVAVCGLLVVVASPVTEQGSRTWGFSSCSM